MVHVLFYVFYFIFIFSNKEVLCRKNWDLDFFKSKSCDCKIVGGEPVDIKEVPYQVYLHMGCGGSILNPKTIVTAAHCIKHLKSVIIRVGSSLNTNGGQTYVSSDLRVHPKYVTKDYDVGILKLAEAIVIDGITTRCIKLAQSGIETAAGTQLLVTGWGATQSGHDSETLLGVKVPVVSEEDCKKAYGSQITPRMICAADEGKDSCQGDSGGPAVSLETGELIGLVSWGTDCARPGYPGVYVKVSDPDISAFIKENFD